MKKIIVIDGDVNLLTVLSDAFKSHGYEVQVISTGKAGLDHLMDQKNHKNVGLIILERMLPDMEGLAILSSFVKKFGKSIPVVILSVFSTEEDVLAGLDHGATDYITTPFSLPVLIKKSKILMGD